MADFVSVLRRAVGNLENNTESGRRTIYSKARTALRAQLEAIDPPLGPEDIARQIQSLDDAIGELEARFSTKPAASPEGPAPTAPAKPSAPDGPAPEPARPQPGPGPQPPKAHPAFQAAVNESGALGAAASAAARQARETLERMDAGQAGDGAAEPRPPASRHEPVLDPAGPETAKPAQPKSAQPKSGRPAPPKAEPPVQTTSVYDEDDSGERGGSGRVIAWVVLVLVLAGIAGVGFWQRATVSEMIASLTGSQEPSQTADNGKIADRLPAPDEQTGETGPVAPVQPAPVQPAPETAQPGPAAPSPAAPPPTADAEGERIAQVLLIEESAGGVTPASTVGGSVNWQVVDDTEAVGGVDKVIRGDVEVPERGLALTMTIRRNRDQALPASHLIELVFTTGAAFPNEGIAGIPGIIMKATPRSTGQPLVGAVVPVMDNYFLVGLSETELDRDRNIQELTSRDFLDIPVGYKDGGRAVLSLAKGESGKRVFDEAFAAWSQ